MDEVDPVGQPREGRPVVVAHKPGDRRTLAGKAEIDQHAEPDRPDLRAAKRDGSAVACVYVLGLLWLRRAGKVNVW